MNRPRLVAAVTLAALLLAAPPARAEFSIPGFELVHTVPVETDLATPDLRDPVTVWNEMIDGARKEIDFCQFYVAGAPGEPLDDVIDHLERAARRGVKLRFLLAEKGRRATNPKTLERLQALPGLELRFLEFAALGGSGIIHAKYFVVDGAAAFLGSQNFDWRALKHIHETGLRITEPTIVGQLGAIFAADWAAQARVAAGQEVAPTNRSVVAADDTQAAWLVASPNAFNPKGVGDLQSGLVKLLGAARDTVRVQLLDYVPLGYGPNHTRPYYAVIDAAVRAAAARGVKIELLVSNWNTEEPAIHYLKSLAVLPGVQVRIVTLPKASTGFIPYARVLHTKAMTIDGRIAWVGTSNWCGGYLDNSRNVEVVLRSEKMAARISALHEQLWSSPYAEPLDLQRDYPPPSKGSERH